MFRNTGYAEIWEYTDKATKVRKSYEKVSIVIWTNTNELLWNGIYC